MSEKESKSAKISNWAKIVFYSFSALMSVVFLSFYMDQLSPKEKLVFKNYSKEKFDTLESMKKSMDKTYDKKEYDSKTNKVFLVDFKGDVHASQVENLREQIDLILGIAQKDDKVLIRLESPGGTVSGYSLVADQIKRLKNAEIKTWVTVDIVAASGGYMAAVVADKIIAAPSAMVGSIGVVTEFPNFNHSLKKLGIDWQEYTAGNFKRSVGMFNEVTDEQKEHLKKKLKSIHRMFINHVSDYRDIGEKKDLIFSGDFWTAQETIELKLNLVDELSTSDDVLSKLRKDYEIYHFKVREQRGLFDGLAQASMKTLVREFFMELRKPQMIIQ